MPLLVGGTCIAKCMFSWILLFCILSRLCRLDSPRKITEAERGLHVTCSYFTFTYHFSRFAFPFQFTFQVHLQVDRSQTGKREESLCIMHVLDKT